MVEFVVAYSTFGYYNGESTRLKITERCDTFYSDPESHSLVTIIFVGSELNSADGRERKKRRPDGWRAGGGGLSSQKK